MIKIVSQTSQIFDIAYIYEKHAAKDVNQDSLKILTDHSDYVRGLGRGYALVVADGMTKTKEPYASSSRATEVFLTYLDDETPLPKDKTPVEYISGLICQASLEINGWEGGTTLSAVLLKAGKLHLFHAGDSAVYLCSPAEEGYSARKLTHECLDQKGSLRNALGNENLDLLTGEWPVQPGQIIILMTDGLAKHVDGVIIEQAAGASRNAHGLCQALSLHYCFDDDVTVIVARILKANF